MSPFGMIKSSYPERTRGASTALTTDPVAGRAPGWLRHACSLALVASWIRPGGYASLFYWSSGNSQISGVSPGDCAVLTTTGLCALAAAILAFRRLDIH